MSFRARARQVRRIVRTAVEKIEPMVPLITRIAVGLALVATGLGKWRHFDGTTAFFTDLGLPLPAVNAAVVATLELVGGALLIVGLATRLLSVLLAVTMVVALATAESSKLLQAFVPGAEVGLLDVAPLVLLLMLAWLAIRGPGRWSLDHLVYRYARAHRRGGEARPIEVVVLGGGFGGVYSALELEKAFDDDPGVKITLVNSDNFFLFTPMLHEVAASDLDLTHIVSPIRKLLRRSEFFNGEVLEVDTERREVVVSHGADDPHPHRLRYDHLVLALGAVTNFRGIPGLEEQAMTMKTLGDAIHLRNRIIRGLEESDVECAPEAERRALTFVVAGGGFAGVETIAGINDFARETRHFYPRVSDEEIRMVLVHSGGEILPELSPKLGAYARERLVERGVEVRLGTRVKGLDRHGVTLSDGTVIPTTNLIWTAGTSAHPLMQTLPCPNERGKVVVEPTLAVPGHAGIWALGDCALVPDLARGGFCPPTAQHASRQGKIVARNIAATIRGGKLKPFRFRMLGQLAALGRRCGVANIMGVNFSGFVAWWLWRTIYLMKLPRFERKVRVALDWSLDLFFTKDLVHCPTEQAKRTSDVKAPTKSAPEAARRVA